MTASEYVIVGFALIITAIVAWWSGASGKRKVSRLLEASAQRLRWVEARSRLLEARVDLYAVNFGDAARHLDESKTILRSASPPLTHRRSADDVKQLQLAVTAIDEAQRLALNMDQGANTRVAEAAAIIGSLIKTSAVVCALLLAMSCTERAADKAKQRVDHALDATRSGANAAIDATKTATDKTTAAAKDTADKSKDAVLGTALVVTDSMLTAKVKLKLSGEKLLQGSDIKVDTRRNIVTLSGTVSSLAGRARAEDLANGTEGVSHVINDIIVK